MKKRNLENKIVLITGGARGIGKAIAYELANFGASIIIIDLLEKEGIDTCNKIQEKYYTKAFFIKCDISNENQVKRTMNIVFKKFGAIDILINNAAISPKLSEFYNLQGKSFKNILNVNLFGAFICTKEVVKRMFNKDGGIIFFIGSAGAETGLNGASAYSASKGGLISFAKSIKYELMDKKIKVFWINPGLVETDLTKDFIANNLNHGKLTEPKLIAIKICNKIIQTYYPVKNNGYFSIWRK